MLKTCVRGYKELLPSMQASMQIAILHHFSIFWLAIDLLASRLIRNQCTTMIRPSCIAGTETGNGAYLPGNVIVLDCWFALLRRNIPFSRRRNEIKIVFYPFKEINSCRLRIFFSPSSVFLHRSNFNCFARESDDDCDFCVMTYVWWSVYWLLPVLRLHTSPRAINRKPKWFTLANLPWLYNSVNVNRRGNFDSKWRAI